MLKDEDLPVKEVELHEEKEEAVLVLLETEGPVGQGLVAGITRGKLRKLILMEILKWPPLFFRYKRVSIVYCYKLTRYGFFSGKVNNSNIITRF